MTLRDFWDDNADAWAAFARTPGHDKAHEALNLPPFLELLPPPGRRTLDLGCGEGRVARDLRARGHRVVGVDASPTLVRLAAEADPAGEYLVADAAALPFDDGGFDLVVAFNTLMDFDDMPGAVREAERVLEPHGRVCACITHPLRDAGRFASRERGAPFVIREPYFGKRRFEDEVSRGGHEISFRGWAYPLQDYVRAFEDAGFVLEALREPPDPDWPIPNFVLILARKR